MVEKADLSEHAVLQVLAKEPEERRSSELGPILRVWSQCIAAVARYQRPHLADLQLCTYGMQVLYKIDLTAALSTQLQTDLAQHASFVAYKPAEEVFRQGDIGILFYIILTGRPSPPAMSQALGPNVC